MKTGFPKLEEEKHELEATDNHLNSNKEKLASTDKQEKAASQALKEYMDRIGVDMHRIKLVEGPA